MTSLKLAELLVLPQSTAANLETGLRGQWNQYLQQSVQQLQEFDLSLTQGIKLNHYTFCGYKLTEVEES